MTVLTKERLTEEINNTQELLEKFDKIIADSKAGIEINEMVLKGFQDKLAEL